MSYTKSDPETIRALFGSIAKQYDRTNGILSFQMHRYWNRCLINELVAKNPASLLDLCAGTGAIGLGFAMRVNPCSITLLDFSPEMLAIAKLRGDRLADRQITYIVGDATKPALPSCSVDAITVAYGIRNVPEPQALMREAYRLLRPKGTLFILELTRPSHPFLRFPHTLYLRFVLPLLGRLSTSNRGAYEYLCSSIEAFVEPEELGRGLLTAGFSKVCVRPLMGGIATLILADK